MQLEFPQLKPDIMIIDNRLNQIKKANSKLILDYYMKFLSPYSQLIKEKKEEFFLDDTNYANMCNTAVTTTQERDAINSMLEDSKCMRQIMFFRDLWIQNRISPEVKDKIWLHFQELLALGDQYYTARYGYAFVPYCQIYGDPTMIK